MHVARVDHRGVRRRGVPLPYRPTVEARQRLASGAVVGESAQPHEVVGAIDVAELAEDANADGFLGLDELAVEQLDQLVAAAAAEEVLAELDDRRRGLE